MNHSHNEEQMHPITITKKLSKCLERRIQGEQYPHGGGTR